MPRSIKYELKVSNKNITCDFVLCDKLIGKGTQYFSVSQGQYRYAIHFDCHDKFLVWLKEKNSLNKPTYPSN
jgi:hypothetical protein